MDNKPSRNAVAQLFDKIRDEKITKWEIKKSLKVQWTTVYGWEKGKFRPTLANFKRLQRFIENHV